MLLNAAQIRELAETQRMIEPFVPQKVRIKQISYGLEPYGYTFRLDSRIYIMHSALPPAGGLRSNEPHSEWLEIPHGAELILPPLTTAICSSVEYFRLPKNVTGLLVGKSTYTRQGIVYLMTVVDAGYEGVITFGITNLSNKDVRLIVGGGIGQMLFAVGEPNPDGYAYDEETGLYQHSQGVVLPNVELR